MSQGHTVVARGARVAVSRCIAMVGVLLMLVAGLVVGQAPSSAGAVSASSFQPGNIISDSNFYNGAAMTEAQIQAFLVKKGSVLANHRTSVASRTAYISDQAKPGHVYCNALQGGTNLLASTLIHRAQVACGISAKVILVTLEKEQGLITRGTASEGVLRIAMGYGCPDTAPCASQYWGLGNQVYLAARQFKVYQLPENGFRYRPGSVFVQYHPNAACGGTTVNIRNYATAGLYNYTPYQPNAKALAAFPGVGDSCSSYGNRNFWFMYNAWFGNPTSVDGAFAIKEAYELSGGTAGPLGAAVKALDCPTAATRCWQEFDHGFIYWSKATGAIVSSGAIGDRYRALGGPGGSLGYPSAEAGSFTTVNGNGVVQVFQGGYLYSSAAGVFRVQQGSGIEKAWIADGWIRGSLGWPTADKVCDSSGACSQQFQHGIVVTSPDGAAVSGAIADAYMKLGGPAGSLGYPKAGADSFKVASNGDGLVQIFQGGYLYSSAAGVFKIEPKTPISDTWNASGWIRGALGWPAGEKVCGLPGDGCSQQFQHGTLYAAAGVAGAVTDPKIAAAFAASGGISGPLGYPSSVTSQFSTPANGDGLVQIFQGGYLYSSAAGVFKVEPKTPIADTWNASGWIRGALGWPAGEKVCGLPGGGCSQQFQHGTLYAASGVAGAVTDPKIAAAYSTAGGPAGALGYPTSVTSRFSTPTNGAGVVQIFQGGYLYSSAAGVFKVQPKTPIADTWNASGWIRGALGWPAGEKVCGLPGGGCSQQFQHGSITGAS